MNLEEKFKIALKKDFNLLYQKEFTTDWKEQRLIRGLEIDAMSFPNLAKIAEEDKKLIAEGVISVSVLRDSYYVGDSDIKDILANNKGKNIKVFIQEV